VPDDSSRRPDDERPVDDPTAEGEPTRFHVANTGWPPPPGSAGPALPRRTPGASGGPGGAAASSGSSTEASPAAEPADMRTGWVTSPPLDDEPWAGIPPAGEAEPIDATTPFAEPASGPADEPDHREDAQPDAEAAAAETDLAASAARTSGRHRGPKSRHGRSGHGLRRRGTAAADAADPASTLGLDGRAVATGGGPVGEPGPRRSRRRPRRVRNHRAAGVWPSTRLVVLALAVFVALVFGVLNLVARVWPGPAGNPYASGSTKAAIAAASAVAAPILSYDYTTIDKKAAQLAPLQTATCATQYAQLLTSTVKPLAVQNKAKQQAVVLAAGVTTASKNAVTVLAFMQLTSSNSVKKGTAINEAQISVSMVKEHGRWLLAGTSANGAGNGGTASCGGANPTGQ